MPQVIDARRLLRKHGLRPRKRLGQHFLIEARWLRQVVAAAELRAEDRVLEIGAGLGALTIELARAAAQVVAVELDPSLLPPLGEVLAEVPQVRLVHGDILELDPVALMEDRPYLVVANIPYNITSAVIRHLTEAQRSPRRIVLTIQREVAERALGAPGDMNLLALSVQVYGEPSIQAIIPPTAFYPRPAVESAVLRVDRRAENALSAATRARLFELARAGFAQRRKMLKNSLAANLDGNPAEMAARLERAGIDRKARAQELSLADWVRLAELPAAS